ncbi:MAG: GerMN domain-containing protein [Actinoplanes sp.]
MPAVTARWRALAPAAALLAALVACGVPADDGPRDVDSAGGPLPSHVPLALGERTVNERLCFVRDDRLVRIARRVPEQDPAQQQLQDLLDGPTTGEAADGYSTALTGTTSTLTYSLVAGRAVVDVGDRSEHGVRTDETLAFAQIVCTLSVRPEIGTITFTSAGLPLRVPQPDGSLSDGPLTVADYAELIDS